MASDTKVFDFKFVHIPRVVPQAKFTTNERNVPSLSLIRHGFTVSSCWISSRKTVSISSPELTNQDVLELFLTAESNAGSFCVMSDDRTVLSKWCEILHCWLGRFGFADRTMKAVNAKVKSIYKVYCRHVKTYNRRLQPEPAEKLQSFLSGVFEWCSDFRTKNVPSNLPVTVPVDADSPLPDAGLLRSGVIKLDSPTTDIVLQNQKLQRSLARVKGSKERVLEQNNELTKLVGIRHRNLSNQNVQLVQEKDKLSRTITDLKKKQKSFVSRNVHNRLLDTTKQEISDLKKQLVQQRVELDAADTELERKDIQISKLSKNKERFRKKADRCEISVNKLKEELVKAHESFATDKQAAEAYFQGIRKQLESEVLNGHRTQVELEKQIEDLKKLETKDGGIYRSHVRLVYYDLLTKGVPSNIIQHVVKSVLGKMTDIDTSDLKLPSRSTAQRMVSEAGELAKVRTAYELVKHRGGALGHHSDGTTKSLIHWGTHILKLDAGDEGTKTFTMTISPVPSGKACDTVTQLLEVLGDTQTIAKSLGLDVHDDDFSVARILSRMSDRAPNERAVTKLLEAEKKRTGVPESEERIYQWTCASHKVDNVANAMTNACCEHLYAEKPGRKMVGAKKLIYETNKLICEQSRKEYSKGADFKMFALDKDMYEQSGAGKMQPIVGNRYNIFLMNSVPTILARDLVLVYLENLKDTKTVVGLNLLEKSVHDGYLNSTTHCELLSYAIMYHFILQPLLTKGKQAKSPLEMNWYYKTAVRKMTVLSMDPLPVISDTPENAYLWPGAAPAKDSFQEAMPHILASAATHRDVVLPILEVMLQTGLKKLQDHAAEHLVDDIPSENELRAARVLGSATNDIVESCFGVLDREQTFCPMRNPVNTSALITAKKDKPVDYVLAQTPDLMNKMVVCARSSATKKRKKHGTKVKQQLAIWQSTSAERNALVNKRQMNRNKKRRTFDETVEGIRNGNLLRNTDDLGQLKGKDLDIQLKMWNTLLVFGFSLQSPELLKGYSGLTVSKKRDNLFGIITSNQQLEVDSSTLPGSAGPLQEVVPSDHETSLASSSDEERNDLDVVAMTEFTSVGTWVVVAYAGGVWYPGEVIVIHSPEFATINYLHPVSHEVPLPANSAFQAPKRKDKCRTDSSSVFLWDIQVEAQSENRQYKLSVDTALIHQRYLQFAEKYDIPLE